MHPFAVVILTCESPEGVAIVGVVLVVVSGMVTINIGIAIAITIHYTFEHLFHVG